MPGDSTRPDRSASLTAAGAAFRGHEFRVLHPAADLGRKVRAAAYGDVNFRHTPVPSHSPDPAAIALLMAVAAHDVGDHVVIQFCRCLQDFRLEVLAKDASDLWPRLAIDR